MAPQESADFQEESRESTSSEVVLPDTANPLVPVPPGSETPILSSSLSLAPISGSALCVKNPDSSIEKAFLGLSKDIESGFLISENNQGEIREACGALEKKLDLLLLRTQALEEAVEVMKDEIRDYKGEFNTLKGNEQTAKQAGKARK
ncbi:hypothetical protein NDU88_005060 [Pleurodeles waltl]|uniref:Uncharacterized protein n=1 Tax=Pleurodeles waltl TaxID=8319 RepID=A0AAV7WX75_PLEWA|nr:hypothetical protein NDU88_005060 [Pleurodeles waltl]